VLDLCAAHNNAKNDVVLTTAKLPWGSAAALRDLSLSAAGISSTGEGWDILLAVDCVYPGRRKANEGAAADRSLLETIVAACQLRRAAAAALSLSEPHPRRQRGGASTARDGCAPRLQDPIDPAASVLSPSEETLYNPVDRPEPFASGCSGRSAA
jgi:hypothetical protein